MKMKNLITLLFVLIPFITNSSTAATVVTEEVIMTYEVTIDVVTVEAKLLPNLDTLVAYILTQSKNDSTDVNCMIQVMLNRFHRSPFKYISKMLYSKTSHGSGTVRRGGGRYWFTPRSEKYKPMVQRELKKVLKGEIYHNMDGVYYFSNHTSNYHTSNPAYTMVFQTNEHRYFVES